jgi:hypothetical protein
MPPGHVPGTGGAAPLAEGIPWEGQDGSLFSRWWRTVKLVNFETRPFFAAAAQSNNGLHAATFNTMSGAIWGVALGFVYFVLFSVLGGVGMFSGMGKSSAAAAGFGVGLGLFYWVLMAVSQAFYGFIGPWMGGGIHHVLLMIFKAVPPHREFQHTVRGFGYAVGATTPWMLIPVFGVFPAMFFGIKNLVQAYDEMHQCGVGKVVLALLSPVLCCCICYAVMIGIGVGAGMMSRP